MANSQLMAIAAHLHVVLRRRTGRVTDVEWMVANREYALEIVRFTRARATEDKVPELAEWAEKLYRALLQQAPVRQPLVQQAAQALRARAEPLDIDTDILGTGFQPSRQGEPRSEESRQDVSRFSESRFEDPDDPERRKPRDPNVPRYVGGIR